MKINSQPLFDLKEKAFNADTAKEEKLKNACKDFEAIILKQMLTTMRKSIPKDGLFETGYAQEMYQSMQDEEMAKEMAHGKGMGIADAMYKQISGKIKTAAR